MRGRAQASARQPVAPSRGTGWPRRTSQLPCSSPRSASPRRRPPRHGPGRATDRTPGSAPSRRRRRSCRPRRPNRPGCPRSPRGVPGRRHRFRPSAGTGRPVAPRTSRCRTPPPLPPAVPAAARSRRPTRPAPARRRSPPRASSRARSPRRRTPPAGGAVRRDGQGWRDRERRGGRGAHGWLAPRTESGGRGAVPLLSGEGRRGRGSDGVDGRTIAGGSAPACGVPRTRRAVSLPASRSYRPLAAAELARGRARGNGYPSGLGDECNARERVRFRVAAALLRLSHGTSLQAGVATSPRWQRRPLRSRNEHAPAYASPPRTGTCCSRRLGSGSVRRVRPASRALSGRGSDRGRSRPLLPRPLRVLARVGGLRRLPVLLGVLLAHVLGAAAHRCASVSRILHSLSA